MAKTIEEIMRESCHITDDVVITDVNDVIGAMQEFAAQEVEAYKQRVYREVALMRSNIQEIGHWEEGYSESVKDAMKIIDAVK